MALCLNVASHALVSAYTEVEVDYEAPVDCDTTLCGLLAACQTDTGQGDRVPSEADQREILAWVNELYQSIAQQGEG